MIKKADKMICAWISLVIEKHNKTHTFSYKNTLFTRDEITARTQALVGENGTVRDNEILNLTVGEGNSKSTKYFVKGGKSTLQMYYRLSYPGELLNFEILSYVKILLQELPWNNVTPYNTVSIIADILQEYFVLCSTFCMSQKVEQCVDIITREAIWIAAATLSYNEYHRTKSKDTMQYYYRQELIAKCAHSYNQNNSLDTCRQMVGHDCTKGMRDYSYLIAEEINGRRKNSRRRLSYWNEAESFRPDVHNDFPVLTVDGIKPVSEIISFVRNAYTSLFIPLVAPLDDTYSLEERVIHAQAMPIESLRAAAQLKSSLKPTVIKEQATRYRRDPYVSQYAKSWANGICQLCKKNAPFSNNDGIPYLESHHIIPLSDGGSDSIENVIALCPNCHRKMHIVNDQDDVDILIALATAISIDA